MASIKKLTKILVTPALIGIFALSLTGCDKKIIQTLSIDSGKEYHVKAKKYPEGSLTFKNIAYNLIPKTGQELDMEFSVYDGLKEEDYWKVKIMRIYEDDKIIKEKRGRNCEALESTIAFVHHEEPSTHSYLGEIIYENWETRRTKIKKIEFTGKFTELRPLINIKIQDDKLIAATNDYGDNKGIKTFEVYENERLLKRTKPNILDWSIAYFISKNPYSITITIPLDKEKKGKYKYFSRCVDKNGNEAMSETITINYE